MRLNGIDFFCGAGGNTRGLLDSDHVYRVLGIDIDPKVGETYEINNEHSRFLQADVQTDQSLIREVIAHYTDRDLIFTISAPCQPFSVATKGTSTVPRDLLNRTVIHIKDFKPKYLFIENVPPMINSPEKRDFDREIKKLGYTFQTWKINAADYGIPQNRRRMIQIAVRDGKIPIDPPLVHNKRITIREALQHLPSLEAGEHDPNLVYHFTRPLPSHQIERLLCVPPGVDNTEFPDHLKMSPNRFATANTRMDPTRPSRTILTAMSNIQGLRLAHYEQARALSPLECAILQTFPEWYEWRFRSIEDMYRAIGNSVPPKLTTIFVNYLIESPGPHVNSLLRPRP